VARRQKKPSAPSPAGWYATKGNADLLLLGPLTVRLAPRTGISAPLPRTVGFPPLLPFMGRAIFSSVHTEDRPPKLPREKGRSRSPVRKECFPTSTHWSGNSRDLRDAPLVTSLLFRLFFLVSFHCRGFFSPARRRLLKTSCFE